MKTTINPQENPSLHPQAIRGIDLFNQGLFFEAHEALETAWREEPAPQREFYRGILQVAVAYHHIRRGNFPGAVKLFHRSRQWLAPFPDLHRGINLGIFRKDLDRSERELLRLGPDRLSQFNFAMIRPIEISVNPE